MMPTLSTSHLSTTFSPFLLLTSNPKTNLNFIILPTPLSYSLPAYRTLYARLHADPAFCTMGFGPHWLARKWSDEETKEVILTRDVGRSWKQRGIGDFAVGVLPGSSQMGGLGRVLEAGGGDGKGEVRIVEGEDYETFVQGLGEGFDSGEWVGYAGVRDATTSIPERVAGDPGLPSWEEMVELRYGVAPEVWGKGVAGRAAEAVMRWAVSERGVRRFIAETERENERSGKVLQKLGFTLSGTDYWKEPSEVEWERIPR